MINSKYKDSLFSFLFSSPDLLRELYCALENVSLPPDVPVTINTLKDVIFMDRVNDISFDIGGKIVVLIEHQSTINPNMAVRLLLYIARVYEKMIKDKALYSSKRLTVPKPEFFVLYNGPAAYPEEHILRLSDAFEKTEALGFPENVGPSLELAVRVVNINEGQNMDIAGRCRKLAEYSAFIAQARYFEQKMKDKEAAMLAAIKYCREHDILREFLEQHSTEVFNMLLTEWNWDDAKEVWYEEGMEEGLEKGRIEIARNALKKGLPIEMIQDITGLDAEKIKILSTEK